MARAKKKPEVNLDVEDDILNDDIQDPEVKNTGYVGNKEIQLPYHNKKDVIFWPMSRVCKDCDNACRVPQTEQYEVICFLEGVTPKKDKSAKYGASCAYYQTYEQRLEAENKINAKAKTQKSTRQVKKKKTKAA
ncbi:hypothetical protein [Acinetobacter sp.]|uniref:hypothetical protein n=1 Tax=Acinetobacter sp. TaxID=472 RepID=UPI003D04A79B